MRITSEIPAKNSAAVTPSDTAATSSGRYFIASVTSAGIVPVVLEDGSQMALRFSAGVTYLPLAVTKVLTSGLTATGTYYNAW